jgi:MFS transporter, DHA2 family, multidrug resistance protein
LRHRHRPDWVHYRVYATLVGDQSTKARPCKPLFVGCIIGFTIASMLCRAAQSLPQIVGFRLLQGMCSAALVPLSQATLLDIYPEERRGFAMAVWGMGVMIGPIMGPTLGGFLTEHYDWRWVFYINLPSAILATVGLMVFLPSALGVNRLRFDWLGFAMLSIGIGLLQLLLDRGEDLDWYFSREIIIEASSLASGSICSSSICSPTASHCCALPCFGTGTSPRAW